MKHSIVLAGVESVACGLGNPRARLQQSDESAPEHAAIACQRLRIKSHLWAGAFTEGQFTMGQSLMLSLSGACKRYAIGRQDMLMLLTARKIPAVTLNGRTLILRPMADAYFAARSTPDAPEQLSLLDLM